MEENQNNEEEKVEEVKEEKKEETSSQPENEKSDTLNKELEELNDRYKRLFAEFENYKKRTQKETSNKRAEITGEVVGQVLPILDNLEKAATARTNDKDYQEGVKLVVKQFSEALSRLGMKEIETIGKRFDPELHEAVSHIEDKEKGDQEIVEEYRKGYMIGNKVIRHSMVIVAN